jgi:uncharacterized repeat protein (TIGR01451 family)
LLLGFSLDPSAIMNRLCLLLVGLVFALHPAAAVTMPPAPQGPPGACPELLFVRFIGPAGSRAVFFQGDVGGRSFPAPVVVGLRPGYVYRVQLTDLPRHPGVSLYPTVEVRGMVWPPPGLNLANFAVPIVLTDEDVTRILSGSFITKVIYLECPAVAAPVLTEPDQPIETEIRPGPGRDPVAEARARGRVLLIVRVGEREYTPQELAARSVPGTILVPGEPALAPALAPPTLPWACWPTFDPLVGPRRASEECVCDGGDHGLPAGIGPDGRLHGLDPADTVAEYADSKGRRHVAVSNCVCLFAPRYGVIRMELTLAAHHAVTVPVATEAVQEQILLEGRLQSREKLQLVAAEELYGRQRPSGAETVVGVFRIDQFQETVLVTGRMKGADVVGVCPPLPPGPDRPLCLTKWLDRPAARVGDVVTFVLRYTNQGGRPITEVVVSDSLINRLEYVPGTAVSDREAAFTTEPNEAGSTILRWEVAGQLLPGQSGLVRFQARLR